MREFLCTMGAHPKVDLAAQVFGCRCSNIWSRRPLFGFTSVATHQCRGFTLEARTILAWPDVRKVVSTLIRVVGKDPKVTTVSEMDDLDPRFVCLGCKRKEKVNYNITYEHQIFSWRAAVGCFVHLNSQVFEYAHFNQVYHVTARDHHPFVISHAKVSAWRVLTPAEEKVYRPLEDNKPIEGASCWTCGHCPHYLDGWGTKPKVLVHVRLVYVSRLLGMVSVLTLSTSKHSIRRPAEPKDFFRSPEADCPYPSFPSLK